MEGRHAQADQPYLFDLRVEAIWDHGDGERAGGGGIHRVAVREGMVGGDPAKEVGVVDDRTEEVDRVHRGERRGGEHGAVVRRVEPEEYLRSQIGTGEMRRGRVR